MSSVDAIKGIVEDRQDRCSEQLMRLELAARHYDSMKLEKASHQKIELAMSGISRYSCLSNDGMTVQSAVFRPEQ